MADPRALGIPKAPTPPDIVVRRLVLAEIDSTGHVRLGTGVPLVYAETQAAAPSGLIPGTAVFGKDGSLGQVNSSGTLVDRGAAGSLAVASGGAITFDSTDVVFTSDGTDVDVTGTGKLDMRDDVAHFVDPAAPTKRARIDAGAVTAGQTRVLAMPDANVTLGAYAPTLLNVADEAAFKAAVNLESGVDVQGYSAVLDALVTEGLDSVVVATVGAPNGSGGTNTSAVTVQLYRADGVTPIASVRDVLLTIGTVKYLDAAGPTNASVSLGAASPGSTVEVVAGSQYLITTNATGAWGATMTETDDGTLYLSVKTASGGVSDIARRCDVRGSNATTTVFAL